MRWKLAALLVIGAALRVYGLDWGLPDLFEEATPFFRAWGMWNWGDASGVSFDPNFYRYPSLVFYVHWLVQAFRVGLAWITGGPDAVLDVPADFLADRTDLLLAARAVGAAFGVALIAAAFALGRRLAGNAGGFVAASTVAVNAYLVERSQFIEVDLAGACLTTWAVWACVRVAQGGGPRIYAVAGALVGLATSAKYPGAFAMLPLGLAHGVRVFRAARQGVSARSEWLGAGLAAAGALGAFALTSPFVLIHLDRAWADVAAEREHMQLGHFGVEEGRAYVEYSRSLFLWILGPVGAIAALAGIGVVAVRREVSGLVVVAFVAVYLAVVGSWNMRAERYLANVVPVLWVLAAIPASMLFARRRAIGVALALLLTVSSAWALPRVYERVRPDPRTVAREWLEIRVPAGAFLLQEAWGPDLFKPEDLWVDLSREGRRRTLERTKRPIFPVQFLPTNQTAPEASEAFYDVALFDDVDVIVLSSDVGDRYRGEPDRFPRQLQFYADVESSFVRVAEFGGSPGAGPRITIFARPKVPRIFSQRDSQAGPKRLRYGWRRTTESETAWFLQLALNYESFAFEDEALAAYAAALEPPGIGSAAAVRAGKGLARIHLGRGENAAAGRWLRAAAERVTRPEDRAELLALAASLPASP